MELTPHVLNIGRIKLFATVGPAPEGITTAVAAGCTALDVTSIGTPDESAFLKVRMTPPFAADPAAMTATVGMAPDTARCHQIPNFRYPLVELP
jgi:hypothetical protein